MCSVSENNSMYRNFVITSMMLGIISVQICKNIRDLGFAFCYQLKLNEHIINVKRKFNVNLINICRIVQFIDKTQKISLFMRLHFLKFISATFCIMACRISSSMVSKCRSIVQQKQQQNSQDVQGRESFLFALTCIFYPQKAE